MTFHHLRTYFYDELKPYYPSGELNSIWKLCVEDILRVTSTFILVNSDAQVDEKSVDTMKAIMERLKKHEPWQYITGKALFCHLTFKVDPSVLIPRPETEELVDLVCKHILYPHAKILDIGTGSGCIAISIKNQNPLSHVTGMDISEKALETARYNASALLDKETITFIQADVLKPDFVKHFDTKFDIIVSNPPYIPLGEMNTIAPNVRSFEPAEALFCQDNPMLFYDAISQVAKQLLNPGGLLFFEIHENYGHDVKALLQSKAFKNVTLIKDINGKNRIVKADYKL